MHTLRNKDLFCLVRKSCIIKFKFYVTKKLKEYLQMLKKIFVTSEASH